MPVGDRLEVRRRRGDRRLLRLVRPGKPPVETEGVMGRGEHRTAVDQRRALVEAEAHPLDQRRQVPGVDRLAVDRWPGGGSRRGGRARPRPGRAGGGRAPNRGARSCRRRVRDRPASAAGRRAAGSCPIVGASAVRDHCQAKHDSICHSRHQVEAAAVEQCVCTTATRSSVVAQR